MDPGSVQDQLNVLTQAEEMPIATGYQQVQVPLALCWAITMHKSQGQTMDKAVVDLGKSESTAGLTFVCLSRAKRLVDLLIEPMPFERLSKIGDTPTFQLRLREEVRLNNLARGDSVDEWDYLHPYGTTMVLVFRELQ